MSIEPSPKTAVDAKMFNKLLQDVNDFIFLRPRRFRLSTGGLYIILCLCVTYLHTFTFTDNSENNWEVES